MPIHSHSGTTVVCHPIENLHMRANETGQRVSEREGVLGVRVCEKNRHKEKYVRTGGRGGIGNRCDKGIEFDDSRKAKLVMTESREGEGIETDFLRSSCPIPYTQPAEQPTRADDGAEGIVNVYRK